MDNVTHTLLGVALARSRVVRGGPLVTIAFVVGANAPDIDLAWSTGTDLAYYHLHRGLTHSLAGGALCAVALWGVLLAIGRLRARPPGDRPDPRGLFEACALGVASHIALDAANAYGVRPFLPWSGRWFYGDLFTIVDPWIWLILGGALYLRRSRGAWIVAAWTAVAALVTAAIAALPAVPLSSLVAWVGALAGVVVHGKRRGPVGDASGRVARGAVALLVAYAGVCLAGRTAASYRAHRDVETAHRSALVPRTADPLRWNAFHADGASIGVRVLGATRALDRDEEAFVRTGAPFDDPAVAAVLASCAGSVLLEFFRFPVASVAALPEGGSRVRVQDLRFARDGYGGFGVFEATVDASGRARIDPADCP